MTPELKALLAEVETVGDLFAEGTPREADEIVSRLAAALRAADADAERWRRFEREFTSAENYRGVWTVVSRNRQSSNPSLADALDAIPEEKP